MVRHRVSYQSALIALAVAILLSRNGLAQAPTIEETGLVTTGLTATPGSTRSLLAPRPGAGASLGMQPGRDEMLLGRAGPSAPRVPTSVTMPGGTYQGPSPTRGVTAPPPLAVP